MPIKSTHWSFTKNDDGTTDHFLLSPEGTRSNVPVLSTDASGNTVLVGADGGYVNYGGLTFTVGANGQYSTLDAALTARAAISHTLLASGTGTITYTASSDDRIITLTAAITNETAGMLGVRLNGAGPILRCSLVGAAATTTRISLFAPIDQTYTAVSVEVYKLNPVGICILPGERVELGSLSTRVIPAFTTIYCPVHLGASITYVGTESGVCFGANGTENEIWFKNLVIDSACGDISSIMFSWGNTNPLTDIGYIDCSMSTQSQDLVYFAGGLRGAVHFLRNRIRGTYDAVCNPLISRHLNVVDNVIEMSSRGDIESATGDAGTPCGMALGNSTAYTGTYPAILTTVRGNKIVSQGVPGASGEGVYATCVEVRYRLPSQAVVDVDSNFLSANRRGGTVVDTTKGIAAALIVSSTVAGADTPTIIARNNTINSVLTNSANGTAYSLHSTNAAYSIKRNGNRVINGTLGSNTDDTGFI